MVPEGQVPQTGWGDGPGDAGRARVAETLGPGAARRPCRAGRRLKRGGATGVSGVCGELAGASRSVPVQASKTRE